MLMHTYLLREQSQSPERDLMLTPRQADERNKGATFKNCAPFTKCIN